MFDFLDDVADYFSGEKPAVMEPAFGGLAPAAPAESYAIPGVAPDYSGLMSAGQAVGGEVDLDEVEEQESVNITAYESDDRRGEDFDEVYGDHAVTDFRTIEEMAEAVEQEANGAPIGDLEIADHGAPGVQEVGDQALDQEALKDPKVAAALVKLGAQMGPDGHFYFKGCRVGGGKEGDQLLRDVSRLTGKPVTASSEYQTPFFPGVEGPSKTCYPPEYDEETDTTYQTCTTTTDVVDDAYDKLQEWIGGGIFGMEQSDMES